MTRKKTQIPPHSKSYFTYCTEHTERKGKMVTGAVIQRT